MRDREFDYDPTPEEADAAGTQFSMGDVPATTEMAVQALLVVRAIRSGNEIAEREAMLAFRRAAGKVHPVDEVTYWCGVCEDRGFVPGGAVKNNGLEYTTVRPCLACSNGLTVAQVWDERYPRRGRRFSKTPPRSPGFRQAGLAT